MTSAKRAAEEIMGLIGGLAMGLTGDDKIGMDLRNSSGLSDTVTAIIERHWRVYEAVLLAKISEQKNQNARDDDFEPIALAGWRNDRD